MPALHFPAVAANAPCPLSKERSVSSSTVKDEQVVGDGPVYPVAVYFAGKGPTLELRPEDKQADGTYNMKVRWIGVGYAGPVLIRAARLDGAGTASATFSYFGQRADGGYTAVLPEKDTDMPATTTVSGPGCFAYQVDGTNFSNVIVFRAVTVS